MRNTISALSIVNTHNMKRHFDKGCLSCVKVASVYLSHSLGDCWGTSRPGNQHSPCLLFLCSPDGVAQFQTCPTSDVIFPSLSLSASPSPSPFSALEDCLGKSQSSCDMPIGYITVCNPSCIIRRDLRTVL